MSSDVHYTVDVVLENLESDADHIDVVFQPMENENEAVGLSFKGRFESILTENCDKEVWWVMVEDRIEKDGDFAEKVRGSSVFLYTQCYGWLNNIDTHTHMYVGCSEDAGRRGQDEGGGHC